ncbi:major facilitator superfamily domain-containing protein [Chlamydoabsidia padenii]|nr:major facilitator superfamily domain-containing protein [Chlamydoabsidia padenii]
MTEHQETVGLLDPSIRPQQYLATTNNKDPASVPSIVVTSSDSTEGERKKHIDKILNGVNIYTILVGLWVGVGLASLDGSIVATIYPKIGTEFRRSNDIIWVATSYMLSFTALQPLYGRLSDTFGRKTTLQVSVYVFFIGSLMCGLATDLWTLVIARTVAGIGGGGLNTMSAVITSDLVTLRERGKYQGYANIWYATGALIGAPLGGWLTDLVGWRYCFFINLPFLLISIYVCTWKLTDYNLVQDSEQGQNSTTWERLQRVDYIGATLIVIAILAFMIATSLGGNSRPWSDPLVVSLLVFFVIFTGLFLLVEKNYAQLPLLPWYILTDQTSLACAFTNFCALICSFASTFTLPLYYQALLGYTPSESGIMFLPKVIAGSLGSLYAGVHMNRTGEYKYYLTFVSVMQLASMVCYSTWSTTTSTYIMYPCLFADGFSTGSIITTVLIAMLSCVETKDMATMTSVSYLFRSTGGVIGLCASQAIFQGVVNILLTEQIKGPDSQEIIDIARRSMMEIRQLLPPDVLEIVLDSYYVAIHYSFMFCAVAAFLNVLSTLFIKQNSLKK